MLRPSKHSHPDQTIVGVAVLVAARLRRQRIEHFDSLRTYIKGRVANGHLLFLSALGLLYLLGVAEYRPKTDSLEYMGNREAL
jgi:hypothetical protein